MNRLLLLLFLSTVIASCTEEQENIVARVNDIYLTEEELSELIPEDADSTERILLEEQIVNKWIIDNLLVVESQKIRAPEEIEKLVEQYRNQLYSSFYEEKYISSNLDTNVKASEIDTFYNRNIDLFPLDEPVVKVLAIKVIKESKVNKKIKGLLNKPKQFKKLVEEYQYDVDEIYYDSKNWLRFSTLIEIMPIAGEELDINSINKDYKKIVSDDSFNYYFYFLNVKKSGSLPVNLASSKIVSIIMNERRYKLLAKMRTDIKNKAIAKGDAEILN